MFSNNVTSEMFDMGVSRTDMNYRENLSAIRHKLEEEYFKNCGTVGCLC